MLIIFFLGGLATVAQSEAVLPAYVLGLVFSGLLQQNKVLSEKLRTITFSVLTPFYFIKAGLFVSLPAVAANAGLVVMFFFIKMATKIIGVKPLTSVFKYSPREGNYVTSLMATGLTFGTISSLYGLSHHLITETQYTILVTVVILSALLPTFIAQTWFRPLTSATKHPAG